MKDTIYREDAIKALGEEPLVWCNTDSEIAERDQWRLDRDAILAVPSAQPEQRWIPVSERLPEELTIVLITDKEGDVFVSEFIGVINGCAEWATDDVIAWMPLPEPYKGGEE